MREIDLAFVRGRQDVQHGIGRTAHGDIERHGVFEGLLGGDRARQGSVIVLLVITAGEIDDQVAGFDEEALAVGMGCERRAVAGQRQAERFGQAVHGVGGEHAGARTAGRTGRALDDLDVLVGDLVVGRGDHGVDEVERMRLAVQDDLAGFHRAAGDEDRRDVEAQRRHQHAGGDLVAVGDADHGVGAVGVDHVFDAVGDQFARRQRIEHAVMAHGDAVVDGDGVELLGDTAGRFDLAGDELAEVLEVDVAGHELGEGVHHRDDRLAEIRILHARGAPKAARARHVAAVGRGSGTISWHRRIPQYRWNGLAMRGGKGFAKAGQIAVFGIVLIQSARAVTTGNAAKPVRRTIRAYTDARRSFVTDYSITAEHKKLAFRRLIFEGIHTDPKRAIMRLKIY